MNVPLFRPGKGSPSIFSAGDMNVLVRILRALTNPQIVWGQRDEARLTDGNFLIQLSRDSANQEAGSRVEQYVLIDATNGDYFICRTIDISLDVSDPENPEVVRTIGADDVYIAKPFHLRRSPFDRDVLNEDAPGNIGTVDEITYHTVKESWDGAVLTETTEKWSYEYKSATFRIATNATDADPDNWTTQNQTIIPRFVPQFLDENPSPTIIYAVTCSGLGVTYLADDDTVDITLLALNDGHAWAKTS